MSEKKATLKMMTEKDIEACLERIYKAFDEKNASDLIDAVVRRGISLGAAAMADDLTCGGCDADYYESAREEADEIALGVVFEKGILSGGKCVVVGDGDGLKEFLKEVLG